MSEQSDEILNKLDAKFADKIAQIQASEQNVFERPEDPRAYPVIKRLEAQLTTALARAESLEQKVCDFQSASMLDVGNQGGPCRVEPEHVEKHIKELRAKVEGLEKDLKSSQANAESWESCVRARETSTSPCGHSANFAVSNDGGKRIFCLKCQNEYLETRNRQLVQAIGETALTLRGFLDDAVKYPQLKVPAMQQERVEQVLALLKTELGKK